MRPFAGFEDCWAVGIDLWGDVFCGEIVGIDGDKSLIVNDTTNDDPRLVIADVRQGRLFIANTTQDAAAAIRKIMEDRTKCSARTNKKP